MNFIELASRPVEDLKMLAAQYSIKVHPRAKAETIAKLIVEHVQTPARDPMQHQATKPAKPVYNNTPEEVQEAITRFTAKEGFTVEFPGDNTWIFKFKGAEESGNLSIPMRVIVMKAESVSKGKRSLRGMKGDPLNGTYGDNILMVG